MGKYLLIFFSLVFCAAGVDANDSLVHNQRVHKIRQLTSFLTKNIPTDDPLFRLDSVFVTKKLDSAIASYWDTKHFSARYNVIKALTSLLILSNRAGKDSLLIRRPDIHREARTNTSALKYYMENTVQLCFEMGREEIELFYLVFKPKSDELIYIIEAGGEKEDYVAKKTFINNLFVK